MDNHNEVVENALPPKPMAPWKNATFYGIGGIIIGFVVHSIIGKIAGHQGDKLVEKVVNNTVDTGILTTVLGYFLGERNVTEHKLTVKNIKLQNELTELKSDKSFAQQVAMEKSQPPAENIGRS